ncbi:hypothetical protein QYZ88_007315 [Lachnospiraceae bacterium C1.1]|nr:hypothetical protein [Lachnospiraceae bacterium C1.1]
MKTKRKIGRKIISFLITMAMVVGVIPGMSLTAYAGSTKEYAAYDVTTDANKDKSGDNLTSLQINFNNKPWYIIEDNSSSTGGTLTLLAADTSFGTAYFEENYFTDSYSTSDVKSTLDTCVTEQFNDVADAIVNTDNGKLYLLSKDEANELPVNVLKISFTGGNCNYGEWWLRTGNTQQAKADIVCGAEGLVNYDALNLEYTEGQSTASKYGLRPALQLDLSKVTFDSDTKTFSLKPVTKYPLWVGETQVTSANANNIDGENKVSYDANTNTLTLNNANITSGYNEAGIYYNNTNRADLNIVLKGNNTISGSDIGIGMHGGYSYWGNFKLSGNGTLTTKGTSFGICMTSGGVLIDSGTIKASGTNSGIYAKSGFTIKDGNVEATGANYGIQTMYGVNITGGTVTAEATNSTDGTGSAIYDGGSDGISITGGTVKATGTSSSGTAYGLCLGSTGSITIGSDITSLTVVGKTSASNRNVKNSVAGMGWKTVEGTDDGTEISVNTSGANVTSYKKILFPYTKPAASVTTAPKPVSGLVYTGSAQELVTAGTATGGTMKYALGGTMQYLSYSTSIPTATDVGTYYVWYKVFGDENHSDSEAKPVEVTIAAKQESASVKKTPKAITGLIYNGSAQKLVEAGEAENGTLYYAVTETDKEPESSAYSTDIPSKTNAGTYYVWYKAVGNEGYGDSKVGNVKVEIADNEEDDDDDDDGDEIPKLLEITKNSITVETIDGFEFSINNGIDWQDSGKFEGLESGHGYTIQIRKKGSEEILDRIYAKTNDSDKVTETKEQLRQTIDNGTGIVKAETRVREDVPVGKIENITLDFAKAVMSEAELSRVRKGENCLIYLEVSGNDAQQEQTNIGEKVRENKPDAAFGMIFDISLFKKIEDDEAEKITKRFEENPLEITMNVPEELQSENRMFYVGCEHVDGDTTDTEFIETVKSDDGKQLTFDITGCSTYALYYTDPVKESSDSSSASTAAGYVTRQRVDATKLMSLPSGVKIKYTTSDKKLAKVSRKGVIKIRKQAGTVTITAKNKKTGATIDSCTLVIEKPVIKQKKLVVTGVTAGNSDSWKTRSANEFLGNTSISPKWYSSKPSVAAVDQETGEVTIKGRGKAKIYAVFGADAVDSKFGTRKIYKYKIVSKK